MLVKLKDDKINIEDNTGKIFLEDLCPFFKYDGGNYNVLLTSKEGKWSYIEREKIKIINCKNFEYKFIETKKGIKIYSTFIADKDYNNPLSFVNLNGFYTNEIKRCIVNNFECFNNVKCNSMCSTVDTLELVKGQSVSSGDNIACLDKKNNICVLGAITFNKYFTEIRAKEDGEISASNSLEGIFVKKGERIEGECLYFSNTKNIHVAFSDYSDLCINEMNVQKISFDKPCGFCTWYYYGSKINQNQIYDNINFISSLKNDINLEYIQIDDGWENNKGDWVENKKFNLGMKKISDDINKNGYKSGIWVAPFKVDQNSKLFREHKDWLVKNKDGKPFKGFDGSFCFDFSNKEACEYMSNIFYKISHNWGYRYIKIDLIHTSVAPCKYFKENFTALQNIREGLKLIRNSITKDTFILCCTSPLTPLMGLCDGMRVSVDIFERWESLTEVFKSVFKRYYYNGKFFYNDADCLIMRKKENEDEECWRLCTRNDEEIKTYITAMLASGGIFMIADKLQNFSIKQIELFGKIFPINHKMAVPVDILERDIPSILDFGFLGKNRIIAFFNWTNKSEILSFKIGKNKQAFEFWSQEYIGEVNENFTVEVLPHNVKLFYFSSFNYPCVIGTNDVIISNVIQIYKSGKLKVEFIKDKEIQYISSKKKLYCKENVEITQKFENDKYLYCIKNTNNIKNYVMIEKN